MRIRRFAASILACALSLQMLPGSLPLEVFAKDDTAMPEIAAEIEEPVQEETSEQETFPSFDQTADLDDIRVAVRAEEGVFPEEAVLFADLVKDDEKERAEKAVAEIRDAEGSVSASYVLDIKIMDQGGAVLQPARGGEAELTFEPAELPDQDVTAHIYHVTENGTQGLKAEELTPVTIQNHSVFNTSTDSFSYFVFEIGPGETTDSRPENSTEEGTVNGEDAKESNTQTAVTTEARAVSKTNNIVGYVLSAQINKGSGEGSKDEMEAALEEYPLDPHELSDYGDSPRVRFLAEENKEDPNYLVYRDSYLLISEEEGDNYEVSFSEDGKYAYISPSISEELLEGKHGIVFLKDSIAEDNILVFGGDPVTEGDLLTVPIKDTADISVSELFSDGHWTIESEKQRALLRAGLTWNRNLEGTNWTAEITGTPSVNWPTAGVKVDIWDLYFMFNLDLRVDVPIYIKTTGATGIRESVALTNLSIPLGLFNMSVGVNLEVQFDETPP